MLPLRQNLFSLFAIVTLTSVTALTSLPTQAQSFPPPPQAAPGVRVEVVASGLRDPRGMAWGPDGELYVAEAGTTEGVFVPPPPPAPNEPPTRTRCEVYWPVGPKSGGFTGRVVGIHDGAIRVVADGLPSSVSNTLIGGDRMGAAAVAFRGERIYALVGGGGCSQGHPSEPNAVHRVFANGTSLPIADLSNFIRGLNDSKSPTDSDFEPDGVWYNMVNAFGAFYAIEANHGLLVRIGYDGSISLLADLIATVGDRTFPALTVHRGSFYVGTLGRIDDDFAGAVYRVSRDGQQVELVANGFHGVLGVAFDRRGRLYVLETTRAGVNPPLSDPTAGRLLRIEHDGSRTTLVSNLAFPSALLAGRDGDLYVANCGYHCDDRSRFPSALSSLLAGQVLRIKVAGNGRDRDNDIDRGD